MSKNKVTFGLRNVHIAFESKDGEPGTYETPTPVKGAVGWSPSPEGDSSTVYADDTVYFTTNTNTGYAADLEVINFTDEIMAEMLGWEIDDNGMLVETADARPRKFALIGEVQGDIRNRRFIYYDVQANRPTKSETTRQENVEPNTNTLPVKVAPIKIDDKFIVKGDMELSDSNKVAYDAFFTNVYLPKFTPAP